MAIKQNSIRSHVAAIGDTLSARLEKASGGFKSNALKVVAVAVGFTAMLGGIFAVGGIGASYLVESHRNTHIKNRKEEVLAHYFRFQVGQVLGMNPDKVTAKDLRLAAQMNPELNQLLQKTEKEKTKDDRSNAMSSAGMMAVGWIPGVAALGGVARIGADMAGAVAGGAVSGMFNKDVLEVGDVVEHLDGKVKSGQAVSAVDIMMLRASQDERWQNDFKSRYKTPFHKMSPQTQQTIMAGMPDMLAKAEKDAYALNKGLVSPQSLVMAGAQSTSNFAGNVTERAATRGSFAQAEAARRAAAQQSTSLA